MQTQELVRVPCCLCGADRSTYERTIAGFALERCCACGFVFANPQHTSEGLARLYTTNDPAALIRLYSRIASPSILEQYRQRLTLIETLVPGRGRLLDFACAAGYFFEQAGRRGWDAHGVDVGEWTKLAAEARGVKNLHVGPLREHGFPDHHFDVVYAAQVFEHLQDPLEDLKEIYRVLRPGGLLYIDVPNYKTLSITFGRDDFMLNNPPQHINYFTPRTLSGLLARGGFRIMRVCTSGGLKWENLLGSPTRSELANAHGLGPQEPNAGGGPALTNGKPRVATWLKRVAIGAFVKPVLYDGLKIGMLLTALARRP